MDRATLGELYARTQYRVRLTGGGHAIIRIGRPLPNALAYALPPFDAPWAFVTAWNPYSGRLSVPGNRSRQRQLVAALRTEPVMLMAGVGIADGGDWREPSLFVAGLPFDLLDHLMQPFQQHALVRGHGTQAAELHWLD